VHNDPHKGSDRWGDDVQDQEVNNKMSKSKKTSNITATGPPFKEKSNQSKHNVPPSKNAKMETTTETEHSATSSASLSWCKGSKGNRLTMTPIPSTPIFPTPSKPVKNWTLPITITLVLAL